MKVYLWKRESTEEKRTGRGGAGGRVSRRKGKGGKGTEADTPWRLEVQIYMWSHKEHPSQIGCGWS